MAVNDFSNQNIQDTYQRVVQTDGVSLADGTGSLLPISFDGNNVIVSGSLTAQTYVVSESIVNVSSGSTIFGNSTDDTHTFTGQITGSNTILIKSSTANQAKIHLEDHGNGDPSINFRSGSVQKLVVGHDSSTTFNKFVAGNTLLNNTGIVMNSSGRIGIGGIPSDKFVLQTGGGINIKSNTANTSLQIQQLGIENSETGRYGAITLPSEASAAQVHFRATGRHQETPGIYLGDNNEAVIYGVNQANQDVWNIDQTGNFSGNAATATTASFASTTLASGIIGTIDGGTF